MAGVPPTRSSALPGVQPALTQAPTAAQLKVAALEARRRELAAKRAKLQARNDLRDEVGDGFESLHMRSLRRMAQDRAQVAKERAKWVDNLLAGMKLRRAAMSEPRTNGSGGGNEDSPAAATVQAMGKATRAQLELERTKVRAACILLCNGNVPKLSCSTPTSRACDTWDFVCIFRSVCFKNGYTSHWGIGNVPRRSGLQHALRN